MSEQWVVRWDDRWLKQTSRPCQESTKSLDEAGKWPTEAAARDRLAQTGWGKNAKVERIDVSEPAAKHDVDALIFEANAYYNGAPKEHPAMRLISALCAERERADRLDESRKRECREGDKWYLQTKAARSFLSDVLDHVWPAGTMMPPVGRAARAFLAGEERAPRHDDKREIELLRKELADKGAALERMVDRLEKERTDHDRNKAEFRRLKETRFEVESARDEIAQKREDAIRKSWSEEMAVAKKNLDAEREAHAQTKRALDHARKMMAALTDQRVLGFIDASLNHGAAELVPKVELDDLKSAVSRVLDMVEAKNGNGSSLVSKPCSSGACKGTVCGTATELWIRIDALRALVKA